MDEDKKILWAPWRGAYVAGAAKKPDGCVFCEKIADTSDRENLVLYRGGRCVVLMNLFPYNNGHVMILPTRHVADLTLLDDEEITEMAYTRRLMITVLKQAMRCEGFNTGLNLGEAAGAGIAAHLHEHIVPRWKGDTNFIPVVAGIKVISEELYNTYDKIKTILGGII